MVKNIGLDLTLMGHRCNKDGIRHTYCKTLFRKNSGVCVCGGNVRNMA